MEILRNDSGVSLIGLVPASMDRDGAHAALNAYEVQHNKSLDNRVAARSLLTMGFYRPLKKLSRVKVPMLLIGATRDSVAPFAPKADAIAAAIDLLLAIPIMSAFLFFRFIFNILILKTYRIS